MMKILIVSDTHGHTENLERALGQEEPIDALIHCGDLEGSEDYIEALAECPCYMVAGNNDWFTDLDRELEVELEGTKLLITHGHNYGVSMNFSYLLEEGRSREADVVLFGHIHRPVLEEYGDIILANPGSLSYPRQRGRKPTYLVMEIDKNKKIRFFEKILN